MSTCFIWPSIFLSICSWTLKQDGTEWRGQEAGSLNAADGPQVRGEASRVQVEEDDHPVVLPALRVRMDSSKLLFTGSNYDNDLNTRYQSIFFSFQSVIKNKEMLQKKLIYSFPQKFRTSPMHCNGAI